MRHTSVIVSILIPVKNTSQFLRECLDSIVNQSFTKWELIAIDDHSEDRSLEILKSYSHNDERIKVLANEGNGIIPALRLAYKYASGQYITRMDSDDIMAPRKLELMERQLQLKGEGHLAIGLVEYFSENNLGEGYQKYATWLNDLTMTNSNFSDIYKECSIPSPCWMVHREDLDAAGAFANDAYPEDYDLAFRFKKAGLKIAGVHQVLHRWRDYETRTSRTNEHYADNRFSILKVMHFLDQDRDEFTNLILWGAGKKGKQIAKLLIERNAVFTWVTNNPKKIGKDIYSATLQKVPAIFDFDKAQIIVAVSSPNDLNEIHKFQVENDHHQYFMFC